MFQSLIGILSSLNQFLRLAGKRIARVSIPDRDFIEFKRSGCYRKPSRSWFQSLIGILSSLNSTCISILPHHRFAEEVSIPDRDFIEFKLLNFLRCLVRVSFQSLIGILSSLNPIRQLGRVTGMKVSIPDRDFIEFKLWVITNAATSPVISVSIPDRDFSEFKHSDLSRKSA